MRAIGEVKLEAYARYLLPDELERMRNHQETRAREWPALLDSVRRQMRADPSPAAPQARELGGRWFDLFQDMVGADPATVVRFREAIENEPLLRMGRGMSDEMLGYLRSARG